MNRSFVMRCNNNDVFLNCHFYWTHFWTGCDVTQFEMQLHFKFVILSTIFIFFWKVFVKPIKCYEAYSRASSSRVANQLSWEHVLDTDPDFKFQLFLIEDSSLAMIVVLVASKLRPIFDWLHGINAIKMCSQFGSDDKNYLRRQCR